MKVGISQTSIKEETLLNNSGPSREDLNKFMDDVTFALQDGHAEIESPRTIIEYYNKGNIQGFDEAGYFIYRGVKVYETGKKIENQKKELANFDLHKKLFQLP